MPCLLLLRHHEVSSLKQKKRATHDEKMATCTVMEHARSVLHLFLSCVALGIKLETVNETVTASIFALFVYLGHDCHWVSFGMNESVFLPSGPSLRQTEKKTTRHEIKIETIT